MERNTEAWTFEILKLKNLLKKSWNPPESAKICENLEYDAITVSNLVQKWSISTQIIYYCLNLAKLVLHICSNKCRIRARCILDKNNNVYKTKRKETNQTSFFTKWSLKSRKMYKSRRVLLSRKTVYSGISKLIL